MLKEHIDESKYSWFRRSFWPIYGAEENKKFLLLLFMMILGLFNYTCLRIHKDDFILGSYMANKDTLQFLKLYGVLPFSFLFVGVFWWVSNKLSKEKLFFATLVPFFLFFMLFTLVFMPYSNYFHLSNEWVDSCIEWNPAFKRAYPLIANWTFSLFFMISELWGNVIITFLFWGFVNEIVRKDQIKRFYSGFTSYGNIGLIAAGYFIKWVTQKALLYGKESAEYMKIKSWIFYIVLLCIFLLGFVYWAINNLVLPYETIGNISFNMKKKAKGKSSISESFKTIVSSKYLLYILILVVCYGITANLVEGTWKGAIKAAHKHDYDIYMADFFIKTGYFVCIFGFLTKGLVARFGWLVGALSTPLMMFSTSTLFFVYLIFGAYLPTWMLFGYDPLVLTLVIGAIQNIGSKSTKYTLFDTTTQALYLPLDEDTRLKGKAAVDVLGGRAGKSGGAFIQSTLSMIFGLFGSLEQSGNLILFTMSLLLCGLWIFATIGLSRQYSVLLKNKEREEKTKALEDSTFSGKGDK